MHRKRSRTARVWISLCLAVFVVFGLFQVVSPPRTVSAAVTETDADTTNQYQTYLGASSSTRYAGRVWTDKTVSQDSLTFTGDVGADGSAPSVTVEKESGDDFLVAYSALATSRAFVRQQPADVVFILDFSASMTWGVDSQKVSEADGSDSRIQAMVDAMNSSIDSLVKANEHTRIAIVTFKGTSEILLPLTEASQFTDKVQDGQYLTLTKFEGTPGQDDGEADVYCAVNKKTSSTAGGTNIQAGLYEGMEILASVKDTEYRDGEISVTRIPNVILMSDGAPTTHASSLEGLLYEGKNGETDEPINNNTTVNTEPLNGGEWWKGVSDRQIGGGDNSMPYSGNGFMALLTASYMKNAITDHYYGNSGQQANIYTIGFSTDLQTHAMVEMANVVLNPAGNLGKDSAVTEEEAEADYPEDGKTTYENPWEQAVLARNQLNDAWEDYQEGRVPTVLAKYGSKGDPREIEVQIADDAYNPSSLNYPTQYFTAENAEDLNEAFKQIASSITSQAETPTHVEDDPVRDGYISYTDPIGEYMEVKDVKAILYNGTLFEKKEKRADGVYVFEGEINSPVYGTHSLSEIEIRVDSAAGSDGGTMQTLHVNIPASAIPLRVNTLTMGAQGSVSNSASRAYPIRILYTVGMQEGVVDADGQVTGKVSDAYIDAHSDGEGNVNFYSNLYTGQTQGENPMTVGDAYVTFTPANTNPFYFVQENTPLYLDESCKTPAESYDSDALYYFPVQYYEGNSLTTIVAGRAADLMDGYTEVIGGQLNLKAGSPRLGNLLDYVNESKTGNQTGTAESSYYPTFEGTPGQQGYFKVYLGNNGVRKADAPASLTIAKTVTADQGLTAPDKEFSFEVTIDSQKDKTVQAVLHTGAESADRELNFDENGTAAFTLKNGQSLEIPNLRNGSGYSIKEVSIPSGFALTGVAGAAGSGTDQAPAYGTMTADDAAVTFSNHYSVTPLTSDSIPLELGGTKTLTGREFQTGDAFTFTIAAAQYTPDAPLPQKDGQTVDIAAIQPGGGNSEEFQFEGTITFTHPGEYRYIIREAEGTLPGVDYDPAVYRLALIVMDNGDGTLRLASTDEIQAFYPDSQIPYTANPYLEKWNTDASTFQKADSLSFANSYSAQDAAVSLSGTKILDVTDSDRKLGDNEFTFKIEALGSNRDGGDSFTADQDQPMPAVREVQNIANGDVAFGEMKFTQAMVGKTFGYKITETAPQGVTGQNPEQNGITYDLSEKIVKVTVSRSSEGGTEHVVATVTPDNGGNNFTFRNSYEPEEIVIGDGVNPGIAVRKTFAGRPWNAGDSFTYKISSISAPQGVSAPLPGSQELTVGQPVSGSVNSGVFGKMTFGTAGTYVYEIAEIPGNLESVDYDDHTVRVTVEIEENKADGTLSAEIRYDNSRAKTESDRAATDQAAFTNTYSAEFDRDTAVNLKGRKTLTGAALADGSFYFTVEPQGNAPMGESQALNPNTASGEIDLLKNVVYEQAGSYTYLIREQIPEPVKKGMSYDPAVYRVTVNVNDDGAGRLYASAPVIEKSADGQDVYEPAAEIAFSNYYQPLSTAIQPLSLRKILQDSVLEEGDFSFEMSVVSAEPRDGVQLPEQTVVSNGADGSVQFGDITFTKAGTYRVQVKEIAAEPANGIIFDRHAVVSTFRVSDQDGQLVAVREGTEGSTTFTNRYAPQQAVLPGATELQVTKNLEGRQWFETDIFRFKLEAADDATIAAVADGNVVLSQSETEIHADTPGHAAGFGDITFKKAGDYSFKITEENTGIENMVYDPHSVTVAVKVTDNHTGSLLVSAAPTVTGSLTFTNRFTPEQTTAVLRAQKEMDGRELTANDVFEFTITAAEGSEQDTPLPDRRTVRNDGDGNIVFDPIAYDKEGTYIYHITETGGSAPGVSNDSHPVTATVTVDYDEYTGKFSAAVEYAEGDNTITNIYRADPTEEGAVPDFTAVKKVTASGGNSYVMTGEEFKFQITPAGGNPSPDPVSGGSVFNDDEGNVVFARDVVYTVPGEYVYMVEEIDTGVPGITCDDSVYKITVKVTDPGDGQLEAEYSLTRDGKDAEEIVFDNSYHPRAVGVTLQGRKILDGKEIEAGEFRFILEGVSSTVPSEDGTALPPMPGNGSETANTETGTFRFGAIEFTAPGTYTYQIREKDEDKTGYAYDKTIYEVKVTVSDQNGELKAETEITGGAEIVFHNSYKPLPAALEGETAIAGHKTLNGRPMEAGEFCFLLLDESGQEISRTSNREDGSFAFGSLNFEKAGTYYYTVAEENTELGGVSYDENLYTVKVTVKDAGGRLEAAAEYLDGQGKAADSLEFVNNYQAEPTSVQLGATKLLTGRSLREGEFIFILTDENGEEAGRAANSADGVVRFPELVFEEPGVWQYQISEMAGSDGSVIYDDSICGVTITVTDNMQGHLEAAVEYDGGGSPVFQNVYTTAAPTQEPTATPAQGQPGGAQDQGTDAGGADTGDATEAVPYVAGGTAGAVILAALIAAAVRRRRYRS